MNTSIQNTTQLIADCADNWQPRPALAEAMRRIATIAENDETAVISERAITFQNQAERTTISAMPINVETLDGLWITECITIRTPLTSFKLFDEKDYAFINIFATTGAVVRDANGEDAIVSRLPLFKGDNEALADLYMPLIANAALLHLIGPLCGFSRMSGEKDKLSPAQIALAGWNRPSYWHASEFEYAGDQLWQRGIYAYAGPFGLTAEFAWEEGATSATFGDSTSLLQICADQPHPYAGNGLFYRLDLPLRFSDEEAQQHAANLNRAEADGIDTPPFFGAWCSLEGSGALSFAGFWPNLLYKQGTVANIAFWCAARSRTAKQMIGNGQSAGKSELGVC